MSDLSVSEEISEQTRSLLKHAVRASAAYAASEDLCRGVSRASVTAGVRGRMLRKASSPDLAPEGVVVCEISRVGPKASTASISSEKAGMQGRARELETRPGLGSFLFLPLCLGFAACS